MEMVFRELLKAYNENDVEYFEEINSEFGLGLTSIDQVELVESRPVLDLSRYYENAHPQYMRNYTTSRKIVELEPLHKHVLLKDEFKIRSYSIVIYRVLNQLKETPYLDAVLENVEINMDKDMAMEFLLFKGLVEPIGDDEVIITDYGEMRLRGVNWVKLYETYLDYFDFDDFEHYMKVNDTGNVVKNAHNYLNDNLKVAYDEKDFYRLHDVFSSKALLYLHEEKFNEALNEELKVFILKLNPVYLNKDDLKDYVAVEYPNINNIVELADLIEIEKLDSVFSKAWCEMELDSMLMSESEAFQYLERATNGETIPDLSAEIADKYF